MAEQADKVEVLSFMGTLYKVNIPDGNVHRVFDKPKSRYTPLIFVDCNIDLSSYIGRTITQFGYNFTLKMANDKPDKVANKNKMNVDVKENEKKGEVMEKSENAENSDEKKDMNDKVDVAVVDKELHIVINSVAMNAKNNVGLESDESEAARSRDRERVQKPKNASRRAQRQFEAVVSSPGKQL
jgi:hypothetical protein